MLSFTGTKVLEKFTFNQQILYLFMGYNVLSFMYLYYEMILNLLAYFNHFIFCGETS